MVRTPVGQMVGTPMGHQEGPSTGVNSRPKGLPTHQIIFLTVHRAVNAVESLTAQSSP